MVQEEIVYRRNKHRRMTWQEWWYLFKHGRTHVSYGLIVLAGLNTIMAILEQNIFYRAMFVVNVVLSVGALIDIVAHLYYH
jgi:hypothetical protein